MGKQKLKAVRYDQICKIVKPGQDRQNLWLLTIGGGKWGINVGEQNGEGKGVKFIEKKDVTMCYTIGCPKLTKSLNFAILLQPLIATKTTFSNIDP